jgi:retron-type reverse transcriptase
MPIMLQQGFELLAGKLLMLLRARLALGYNPMSWRHTRVVFIPKLGKPVTQAKSLRPIILMSFILKILEKLFDRHIRGGVLVEKPLHQNQFAHRTGMSTETALFQVFQRQENCLEHKEIALGVFLDIEGTLDNTSFKTIITTARDRGLEETCCRWIESMLGCRLEHVSLIGSNLTANVARGSPQGGVLSPLLWNVVVYRL